ncbi:MAG: TolC family protein [Actinomycetota bacterium]|nr:TolC family protein [Actinomycetota bacterium]
MSWTNKALLCLWLVLQLAGFSGAAEKPYGITRLTMMDAVRAALERNPSIRIDKLSIQGAMADLRARKGAFDPVFEGNAYHSYEKTEPPVIIYSPLTLTTYGSLGFSGILPPGTRYSLEWENQLMRYGEQFGLTVNPYVQQDLKLTLTQPLLKGLWAPAQKTPVKTAAIRLDISTLQERKRAEDIAVSAARAYWRLYQSARELDVARLALELAQSILSDVRGKIQAGQLPDVDEYGAEAEVFSRNEAFASAEKEFKDSQDGLREVMNLGDWNGEIVAVEPPHAITPQAMPALNDVLSRRPDYQIAEKEALIKKTDALFLKNQTLPELDVYGSSGLNGLNSNYNTALRDFGSGSFHSWEVGINFSIPIGNRTALGNYEKAVTEGEKALATVEQLKQAIGRQIREDRRALQVAALVSQAASKKAIAAGKLFEGEKDRFSVGLATTTDLLKYEVDYARALSEENKARVAAMIAALQYQKSTGTLLDMLLPLAGQ